MKTARHSLHLLLLAVVVLGALSVEAQMFASNGSFIGLLNDELVPSGKPYGMLRHLAVPGAWSW